MIYRLFIYKTTAVSGHAPAIATVDAAIRTNYSKREWRENCVARYMMHFDAEVVKEQIEKKTIDKCHIIIKYPPKGIKQTPYLYIATSYERVKEVLPHLYAIVTENDLVLYDAERYKSFYKDIIEDSFINLKQRGQSIKKLIMERMKPVWRYQKLLSYEGENAKYSSYVVTLRKIPATSFEERTLQFYNCLKDSLVEGEKLECKDKSFIISGTGYSITLCLEAYKKHPNMIGYIEDEMPQTALLHRMGCVNAFKWMEQCSDIEQSDIMKRLHFFEMTDRYRNPGDRFVKSVVITKRQRKEFFGVRYSGFGYYGGEILFNIVPKYTHHESHTISVLKIELCSASFILPFVSDYYPYIYKRYYCMDNHLPTEMWEKIVEKIKYAKKLILEDTFNPKLEPYIKQFNLFVLSKEKDDEKFWKSGDGYRIKNEPVQFLHEHRYEVAHLLDIFIEWSEIQLYYYGGGCDGRMFSVKGP